MNTSTCVRLSTHNTAFRNYKSATCILCNGENLTIHCLIIHFWHFFQAKRENISPSFPFLKGVLIECAISLESASHAHLPGVFLRAFQRNSPLLGPGTYWPKVACSLPFVMYFNIPGSHGITIGLPACLVTSQVTSDNGDTYSPLWQIINLWNLLTEEQQCLM